VVCGGVWLV